MMSTTVWILFGARELAGLTLPHPYFIGVYATREAARAARARAIETSSEEHPHSVFYVKEARLDSSYPYDWSTMDD